ncbi:TetR/AcrR family transcriptional regulator [Sphingomonas sp. DBB INV C78]|uniref:TetR/AcrR family transcriptional regulator n=1 Tax=Sphingomonas sp. DBB INV C78 TaxID=3349434 RepID=UPI0036D3C753
MSKPQSPSRSKRGRPSLARLAAIEPIILSAAFDLFLEEGFDVATMVKVAEAASLSKSTLYSRFPTKEALFDAVIRERVSKWSRESSLHDHELPEDIGGRLHYHARNLARSMMSTEAQDLRRLVYATAERFPRLSRTMYETGYLHMVEFIRQDIEEAALRDSRPVRDAEGVARHFTSAILGWVTQEASGRDLTVAEAETAAARCADLVLAARDAW